MTTSEERPTDMPRPDRIRTDIPHPARVYDYWLGGKDNFAIDRQAAEEALALLPEFADYAVENRKFLVRAVRFACAAGIRQFLDLGTGLPTSPNVHEVAQSAHPGARVVYVDNDPVVFVHAEELMTRSPDTSVIWADLRDPGYVLREAGRLLDFSEPVALMFVACLHHLPDGDDPAQVVGRCLTAMAPGSQLILSHQTDEFAPDRMRQASAEAAEAGLTFVPRSRADILRLFNGCDLVEPGLVLVSYWRPDGPPGHNADRAWAYGGIARL